MSKYWYDKYHKEKESPEFLSWFINCYGADTNFEDVESEQDEYWVRRGFALMGWNASLHIMRHLDKPQE
ncbi:MAG: hypothetical protein M0R51_15430 [Clostridia bacterium]|jgi:hypothetical protein|nr:hypothetical protein [Clostridia bacterium]